MLSVLSLERLKSPPSMVVRIHRWNLAFGLCDHTGVDVDKLARVRRRVFVC